MGLFDKLFGKKGKQAAGSVSVGAGKVDLEGGRRAAVEQQAAAPAEAEQESTLSYDTRIVAAVRKAGGLKGLVYTATAPNADKFAAQVEDADAEVAVVRRLDFDSGVVWERPFPYPEAFEEQHYVRAGEVLVMPRLNGGITGVNVETGRALWELPHDESPGEGMGVNVKGQVVAPFEDRSFVIVDPASGAEIQRGRLPPGEDKPEGEGVVNWFSWARPDTILVGEHVVEVEEEGIRVRPTFGGSDELGFVHKVSGGLASLMRKPPAGAAVSQQSTTVIWSGGTEQHDYQALVLEVGDWQLEDCAWFVDGKVLGVGLLKERRKGNSTGFAAYDLKSMKQLCLLELGKPKREEADVDWAYAVDGFALVRVDDCVIYGEEYAEGEEIEYGPAIFVIDQAGSKPAVVARLALDEGYNCRLYDRGKQTWRGML